LGDAPRRVALACLAAAAALVLSSCASTGSRVSDAIDSAESATASASIALGLYGDGRALPGLTDTVLGDALTELGSAESDLSQLGPIGNSGAAKQRDAALATIRAATDAVLAAREVVAAGGDPDDAVTVLDHVTDALHDFGGSSGS
jgi:hypothetical protein